jgi:shikimate dehydrogenase
MQNAAFAATGCNAVYVALRVHVRHLAPLMQALAQAGGGGNVTVPYKQVAAAVVDHATDVVAATGACNTFFLADDKLHGDNTDVAGFAAVTSQLLGSPAGLRALVLGAGGAARAALFSLLRQEAANICVLARTTASVEAMLHRLDPERRRTSAIAHAAALRGESFDLVINATALGLGAGDPLPLDLGTLARAGAALDLTYTPAGDTNWTRHAQSLGIRSANGLAMLVEQGAAAFERWTGGDAPRSVMRVALGIR